MSNRPLVAVTPSTRDRPSHRVFANVYGSHVLIFDPITFTAMILDQ